MGCGQAVTEARDSRQPRAGLIGGAVISLAFAAFPAVTYLNNLNSDEVSSVVTIAWVVIGLTSCAILAYWAACFGASKTRFTRRDALLTLILALTTGSALSALLWVVGGS
jgi:hypothetical protein